MSPWSAGAVTGVAAFMVVVSVAGAIIPARKAARVDPMDALRAD